MPAELVGLITLEQFHYLAGLAGVASGFLVIFIWGQSL